MATDIGPKIGLGGKNQFAKDLKDVTAQIKTLGTEMALVTTKFQDQATSEEALAAKSKILTEQITKQKEKIDLLKRGLQESAARYGEADAKTQAWQQKLNIATSDLYKMERQLDATNDELEDEADAAKEAEEKTKRAGDAAETSSAGWSVLEGTVKAVGAAMAAAVAAAGAAALQLGKSVVNAYSEYEQLSGGVETLFGDSAGAVEKNASKAFKTAGLSANEYMETVTGFSASLLQSLDGDTERATELADRAIIDMADNANKMGSDISSIQTAYQGFAKQNYTMLDNLKLGYGGTKSEMERLLKDATALSGIEYDIDSYADIIDAIHVIQDNLGITGTTAKEASSTISGSIGSMKSAWENLLSGLGNADADIGELAGFLVESFQNVLTNITPIIENLIKALPTAITALCDAAVAQLPLLLDTAVELFNSVLAMLLELLPDLIPVAVDAVMNIVNTLIENLPLLIDAAIQIILAVVQGLTDALPDLIPVAVDAVLTIVDALIDNLDLLVDAAIALVLALADGIMNALPKLLEKAPEILGKLVGAIIENAPKLLEASLQLILKLVEGLGSFFYKLTEQGREIVSSIWDGFKEKVDNASQWGKDLISNFVDGIKKKWEDLKSSVSGIAQTVKDFLGFSEPKEGPLSNFHTYAPDMVDLFIKGLKQGEQRLQNQLASTFDPTGLATAIDNATVGTVGGMGVTIPLNLDGQTLTKVVAQIQWQQGVTSVRNYGVALA